MSRPNPLPPHLLERAFRVTEARDLGVPASRLRRSDLRRPTHGVRAGRDGGASLVDALALVLRRDQRFSHLTAADIWGLPSPRDHEHARGPVHVATVGTAALMRRRGVVAHRVRDSDTVVHRGLAVSSPARTWAECAMLLGFRDLVAMGDHLVGRASLASVDDLAHALRPRGHGVVLARAALAAIRVGSESPMETGMRLDIVEAGFPEPSLNVDVHDDDGQFLGRVDMCWPGVRIALEYDGDHHRSRDAFRHDQRRANGFAVNGWLVIHATAADAARPAVVFERLRQAFAERARV
uniref:DUF559 domain-containing protein n=1 Tax=Neobacillus citreus TaxID=2833578 RepID=A0A942Y7K5_9BACI